MKRIFLVALLVVVLAVGKAAMAEEQPASTSQVVITASQEFGEGKVENLAGYANVNFFYSPTDAYSYLAGYVGPKITVGNCNIYVMGVTFTDNYGWSLGPSLWFEVNGEKAYFFLEGDYYAPWLSTTGGEDPVLPPHQYYAYSEVNLFIGEKNAIGWAAELAGSVRESSAEEFAFGPLVTFGKIKLWPFYDTTPNVPGQDMFGIRFIYTLTE